ncbi:hypothetical protein HN51_007180 [Arachis hypogaea]
MSLYFFLYPLSSAFFQNDYMTSFFKSWLKLCCSRGSCGGKGEGKGSGRTSGQGHSSEVETHDQEFAVRSRERKQNVLLAAVTARVSIEVGSTFGWQKIISKQKKVTGIDHFGASAPVEKIYKELSISKEVAAAKELS